MQENEIVRILLVDDEPNILTALEFLIQKEGYEVHKSINGEDALAMVEKYKPKVVVLDVMMPRMNGYDVAKRIRSNANFDQTQIIFLTARGTQDDRFEGYGSGAEIYLTKPFDNEELVNTIKELVEFG